MKCIATAPTRVDLVGGTLDLWPVHHLLPRKATVNIGISLEARAEASLQEQGFFCESLDQQVRIEAKDFDQLQDISALPLLSHSLSAYWSRDLPGLRLTTSAQSPAGAGLGGSSSLAIAVGAAIQTLRQRLTGADETAYEEHSLARAAQNIEARIICAPTGCQDYWGALRGGVNVIRFPYSGVQVRTLASAAIQSLQERIVVCYSGQSRASACNNWAIFKKVFDRDSATLENLIRIGEIAERGATALEGGDVDGLIEASKAEWEVRKSLWPDIETERTQELEKSGFESGAYFSRICGAGGGGAMIFFVQPQHRMSLCEALNAAGGRVMEVQLGGPGLRVEIETDS